MILPLNAQIVIQLDKASEKKGKIYTPPSQNKEKPSRGVILHVNIDSVLKPKQKVLFKPFGAIPLDEDVVKGKDIVAVDEEDIILAYE